MKLFRGIISIFSVLVLVTGCLQVETTLHVRKDGSGTISEQVMMSKVFVNMMEEFAQSFQDSASSEEFTLFKEDDIVSDAKSYGENVSYVSHELISNESWEGYKAVYSFTDVSKIMLRPDPDSKVDVGVDVDESQMEKDFFSFSFAGGETAELIINRPEFEPDTGMTDEAEEIAEENNDQAGEQFLKMMEGMSIKVAVEVEGAILNTNAGYVSGSEITLLQMDFEEMMKDKENFKEFSRKKPKSIEEMKEFVEKFPGMKLETGNPVTIKFN